MLAPGLADPGHDAQRLFRAVLDAFVPSRPHRRACRIRPPARAPLSAGDRGLSPDPGRSRHAALAGAGIRRAGGARLRALPYRRADRDRSRRGGLRRAGARHRCIARRLRHRHRPLSRPLGHPGDRGAGARRRYGTTLARSRHRRRERRRRRRARRGFLAGRGPPTTRCFPAASTSCSPPDRNFWRCRAASPWRADHVRRGQGRRDGHRPFARSAGRQAPRRPRRGRALAGADRPAARARRRPRDDRGLLLRPRAGGARHQAGARRSDRGDLPAARLSHDACRASATALPIDTTAMVAERRISSTFKDVPGGQVLGPTYDYTHRLLDFSLAAAGERPPAPTAPVDSAPHPAARRRHPRARGHARAAAAG